MRKWIRCTRDTQVEVQEALFKLGYKWSSGLPTLLDFVDGRGEKALYIDTKMTHGVVGWAPDDEEITLEAFLVWKAAPVGSAAALPTLAVCQCPISWQGITHLAACASAPQPTAAALNVWGVTRKDAERYELKTRSELNSLHRGVND